MIKYTIGEILNKFEKNSDLAFAIKGECKGTLIFIDSANNDKLTNVHADGYMTEDFNFILSKHLTVEESKEWIFVSELNEEDEEYLAIKEDIDTQKKVVWKKYDNEIIQLLNKQRELNVSLND